MGIADPPSEASPPPGLDALGVLEDIRNTLHDIARAVGLGEDWGAIDHMRTYAWAASGHVDIDRGGIFNGVGVTNLSEADMWFATVPGVNAVSSEVLVPTRSMLVLPLRGSLISIGGAEAGSANVIFYRRPPSTFAGAIG